jgi:hypothetical protein
MKGSKIYKLNSPKEYFAIVSNLNLFLDSNMLPILPIVPIIKFNAIIIKNKLKFSAGWVEKLADFSYGLIF